MKRLLFVFYTTNPGGIYTSLVNLLNQIYDEYEIDFLCFCNTGNTDQIPKNINILPSNEYLRMLGQNWKDTLKSNRLLGVFHFMLGTWSRLIGATIPHKIIYSTYKLKREYDVAISCSHDANDKSFIIGCNDFVRWKAKAKQKMTFVHCDFLQYGGNTKGNRNRYYDFDKIVCVSNSAKSNFLIACPDLKEKTFVVTNCINTERIKRLSEENVYQYDNRFLNMITISRLSAEKGLMRTAEIIGRLVEDGYKNIRWNIIGGGEYEKELKCFINSKELNENIVLHGETTNPYIYYPNADLFLLLSYHECAPMVIQEAQVFGVPILMTNTLSAFELLRDCEFCYVCDNNAESIYSYLKEIFDGKLTINRYISKKSFVEGQKQFEKIIDK